MRDVVFTAFVGVCGLFVPRAAWFGVLLLAWLGYMNAQRMCYGFAFAMPFVAVITGLTVFGMVISSERKSIPWTREVFVLLAFIAWMNVTVWFALNPEDAWPEWNRCMKIQILTFLAMMLMKDRLRLNLLVWVIVVSIGVYGLKGGLFALATGGNYHVQGPEFTFIEDNNNLALALSATVPLMRYLQLIAQSHTVRLALSGLMALTCLAILSSYSRAGFLALLAIAILMVLKSRRKVLFTVFLAASLAAMLMFMPQQWYDRMHTIDKYHQDPSAQGRLNAWQFAINLAADRPWVGGGFKAFSPELFRIYAPEPENQHDAHSIYFQVLGEQGYPGLALFLLLWVLTWRSAAGVKKMVKPWAELKWLSDLAAMSQVSLAAYLIGGAFVTLAYFDLPYHILCIVVLARYIARNEIARITTPETTTTEMVLAEA